MGRKDTEQTGRSEQPVQGSFIDQEEKLIPTQPESEEDEFLRSLPPAQQTTVKEYMEKYPELSPRQAFNQLMERDTKEGAHADRGYH
jgi:hypothetical protein